MKLLSVIRTIRRSGEDLVANDPRACKVAETTERDLEESSMESISSNKKLKSINI